MKIFKLIQRQQFPIRRFCQSQLIEQDIQDDQQIDNFDNVNFLKDENDGRYLYKTRYGLVKMINQTFTDNLQEQIKQIYYINNRISTNYIRKILKNEKDSLIVFQPESNYRNVELLLESSKKMIEGLYYGNMKRPKNPYRNCKSESEIFHLNRRLNVEQKNMLNRIMVFVNYDGSLRLKSQQIQSKLILNQMGNFYEDPLNKFMKHDFLISFNSLQGILSAEEYEKKGISIKVLDNKIIYPKYSVFSPTSQQYLNLLQLFINKKYKYLSQLKNSLDIGCGTGILSIILNQNAKIKDLYCIDLNEKAIQNTQLNATIFDIKVKAQQLNIINQKLDQEWPQKYDIIIFNPPWVNAKNLNQGLDLGVYDYKEQTLINGFKLAQKHLNMNGIFLFYYSDFNQKLKIQDQDRIQKLCESHNFQIKSYETCSLIDQNSKSNMKDVLYNIKLQSKIYLYEIQKVN